MSAVLSTSRSSASECVPEEEKIFCQSTEANCNASWPPTAILQDVQLSLFFSALVPAQLEWTKLVLSHLALTLI